MVFLVQVVETLDRRTVYSSYYLAAKISENDFEEIVVMTSID